MLLGMAEMVADKGYARTSVADVLKRVHVSRDTFYQHFSGKEDCFLAALDQCGDTIFGAVVNAVISAEPDATGSPLDRFDRALRVYLDTLTDEWTLARTFFLEGYAAGPVAQQRRFEVQERFVKILAANFAEDPAWRTVPDPLFAARTLAAALNSLVTGVLASGERDRLPALHGPVTELLRHLLR